MSTKRKARIAIDIAMSAALPFLMAYSLIGEATHEWLGIAILALFAAHHVLNFRWFKTLSKGKYTPTRIFGIIVNLLLSADMLCLAVSGIILSNHVFTFLPIMDLTALARPLHLLGSYWGLVLMSVHIGLHWGMAWRHTPLNPCSVWVCRICCLLASCYGFGAFISRNYLDYMLLQTHFVFLDYSEPMVLFLIDQLAIITLFAAAGYYLKKLFTRKK